LIKLKGAINPPMVNGRILKYEPMGSSTEQRNEQWKMDCGILIFDFSGAP
jgi:hypothetical protein